MVLGPGWKQQSTAFGGAAARDHRNAAKWCDEVVGESENIISV